MVETPKRDNKQQKARVQLDLLPRNMERLVSLRTRTEASSFAEVVKNALRIYEALLEETEAGNQLLLRNQQGEVTPFRLFL